MLETIGIAKNGHYKLQSPSDELLMRWLSESEGNFVKAKWTKVSNPKTNKQLGAIFGLAVEMIRQAMIEKGWTICGVAPNKQMIHEILSKCCGGVGEFGQMKRLSEMTSTEANKYLENVRDWAATQLNIYIPDPDPNWRNQK